ncbi:glycerophosphodiester phosphodiesterase [Devosia sp.]|uniref:glycerophosphodiester phosphodiesterase n=1 Tax=Devosia sp. TaxID=1871048 RepID=UPI002AFEFD89|nr:glycerophosphodiester phosphodiesterase family protein [Devosia sp.]
MPKIVAHRGYSSAFRENAIPAWAGAVKARADVVEIDVRRSADGAFVCAHDPDLRIAGHPGIISQMRVAELARISAGGEPAAPLLHGAFSTIPPSTAILFDVKDESPSALTDLHAFRQQFPDHRVIFGLHSLASVERMRGLGGAEILGFLGGEEAEDDHFFAAGGNILRIWEAAARPERIGKLRGQQREVWMTLGGPGTDRDVGDYIPEALRSYHHAGFTGFLVNDPKSARQALAG